MTQPTPSPIPEEAVAQARRALAPMIEGVQKFREAIPAMMPQLAQLAQAVKAAHDALHAKYMEVGAPYGETPEGFERWAREAAHAMSLQREAEAILQRHEELASMRRLGPQLRAQHEAEAAST